MKLRTAIKIQRYVEEPWRSKYKEPRYRTPQILESRRICRKKWRDDRIPYMPDDEELHERFGLFGSLLIDISVDDKEKAEQIKQEWWSMIES